MEKIGEIHENATMQGASLRPPENEGAKGKGGGGGKKINCRDKNFGVGRNLLATLSSSLLLRATTVNGAESAKENRLLGWAKEFLSPSSCCTLLAIVFMAFESGTVDSSPHRSQEIFSEKSVFVKSRMIFANLHAYAPKWDPFNFVLVETVEDVSAFPVLFHPMLYNCHPCCLTEPEKDSISPPSLPPNSRCPKNRPFWASNWKEFLAFYCAQIIWQKGDRPGFWAGRGARARNRSLRAQKQTQYMPTSMESCKMGLLRVT